MKKALQTYLTQLEEMEQNFVQLKPDEVKRLRKILLTKISFFQHERLIHLLVTLSFALFFIFSLVSFLLIKNFLLLILAILLLILLIPYIFHYYTLENGVQQLYRYYELFCAKMDVYDRK